MLSFLQFGNTLVSGLLALIHGYQWCSQWWPKQCRFYPSCSQYMIEALQTHGLWKGLGLGTQRLCRCHPGHPGGLDPVPTGVACHR